MHGGRDAYYIVGEGIFHCPGSLSGGHGCPITGKSGPPSSPSFKFGRMFPLPPRRMTAREWFELSEGLLKLGQLMNEPPATPPPDSDIPAGYTYLGQFIAHEITFDATQDLSPVVADPQNLRSPSLDLDSLYGNGPGDAESRPMYEDGPNPARLRLRKTLELFETGRQFDNDLPRDENPVKKLQAQIGDPRNDENLAVAQTHVAFIKFHNGVVNALRKEGHGATDLFDCARIQVIRHFQWLILHDYLPKFIDKEIIECVRDHGRRWFKDGRPEDLYMPLEFSAAAFRLGHTMVRRSYDWNRFHEKLGEAKLSELFEQTALNGDIGKIQGGLPGDWVIDWRRFYQFPAGLLPNDSPSPRVNMAAKIDTHFDFTTGNFNQGNLPPERRSITVRNLLRGFALGLPTGEEVAACIGEKPLSHELVASGPHAKVLSAPAFKGKTPLWYYILKEAELKGDGKLGRVGGRIVAETLIGLIKNSLYSILDAPDWRPKYTTRREAGTDLPLFEMVDLLHFAGVINPY